MFFEYRANDRCTLDWPSGRKWRVGYLVVFSVDIMLLPNPAMMEGKHRRAHGAGSGRLGHDFLSGSGTGFEMH